MISSKISKEQSSSLNNSQSALALSDPESKSPEEDADKYPINRLFVGVIDINK